jgi:hypothetical protein
MSLPEVLLLLREDGRREAGRALVALQTQALAAFAVWDKEAGRRLERLRQGLIQSNLPPEPADPWKLEDALADWGAEIRMK